MVPIFKINPNLRLPVALYLRKWGLMRGLSILYSKSMGSLKEYYKISWRERPQSWKISNFVMIAIHIGIPMYPVKYWAKRGLAFSKYRFLDYFRFPKVIKLVHNYWYFVVLHLTVSLYSNNCKWKLSLSLYNVLYPTCGIFLKWQIFDILPKKYLFQPFQRAFSTV